MKVEDDEQTINIPFEDMTKLFNVAYCITTHKAQGTTIDKPYTIHEFSKMDKRLKYVSLSRARDIALINII